MSTAQLPHVHTDNGSVQHIQSCHSHDGELVSAPRAGTGRLGSAADEQEGVNEAFSGNYVVS